MNSCIRFSPRAGLAMTGIRAKQMGIRQTVEKYVQIKQKVIAYPTLGILDPTATLLATPTLQAIPSIPHDFICNSLPPLSSCWL